MKGLAVHACVGPEQIEPLEEFMQDLKTGSESRKELEQWNAGFFQMRKWLELGVGGQVDDVDWNLWPSMLFAKRDAVGSSYEECFEQEVDWAWRCAIFACWLVGSLRRGLRYCWGFYVVWLLCL